MEEAETPTGQLPRPKRLTPVSVAQWSEPLALALEADLAF